MLLPVQASFCLAALLATTTATWEGGNSLVVRLLEDAANVTTAEGDDCRHDLGVVWTAVRQRRQWALMMVDASGEPGPALLWGNNLWLGSREECAELSRHTPLRTRAPAHEAATAPLSAHFVVVHFGMRAPLQVHVGLPNEDLLLVGLCVPRTCAPAQLRTMISAVIAAHPLAAQHRYDVTLDVLDVRVPQDDVTFGINFKVILLGSVLLTLLSLVTVATACDMAARRRRGRTDASVDAESAKQGYQPCNVHATLPSKCIGWRANLACFSARANAATLLGSRRGPDTVPAIHGLRFLSMAWVLLAHTAFFMSDYADNKPFGFRLAEGALAQFITNASLATDTFFVISGFLAAHLFRRACAKPGTLRAGALDWLAMVAKRFLRLTPTYAFVLLAVQVHADWLFARSLFAPSERPQDACASYWWRNLLYVNNLFPREQMCLSWSWFLADDMQFFAVAAFLLLLSVSYGTASNVLLGLLVIGSCVLTGVIAYSQRFIPTMDAQLATLHVFYDPPWARIGPYLLGVAAADVALRLCEPGRRLGKKTVTTLWTLGSCCCLAALFGITERDMSALYAAVYVAVGRTLWGSGIAWMLVACCTDNAGALGRVLSWPCWLPWSRLTFCAYLINPALMTAVYAGSEASFHYGIGHVGTLFLGFLAMTYAGALLLALVVEAPSIRLLKQLTVGGGSR